MTINIDSSEQSRARLQLQPTPGAQAPPRPTSGSGLRLARPVRVGSALPDPEATGSASPDPWVCAPPRPTGTHTTANHSRSKRMGLGQNSDTKKETDTPRCNPWS